MNARIYRPTIGGVKRWGYWYVDDDGKKRQRIANPETGDAFRTRADVRAYLDELEAREHRAVGVTVDRIASWIFEEGSPWLERQERRRDGRALSESTVRELRHHVKAYILPQWTGVSIRSIRPHQVEDWLYGIDASNRYRRSVWGSFRRILEEAERRQVIPKVPHVELPEKRTKTRKRVLAPAELHELFPKRSAALMKVWQDGRRGEPKDAWLCFAALSVTMFLCGLRPQEARAIHTDQLALDMATLLVTRQMSAKNEVAEYVKGGTVDNPNYRFALVPKMGLWIIQEWIERKRPVDLVFDFNGRTIRREYLRERLTRAAERAGIGRLDGFSPYSGRSTYISVVRPLLDPALLRAMVGHSADETTDLYDRAELLTRARQVRGTVSVIDAALRQ